MTRLEILDYLQNALAELANESGQPDSDTSDGYKLPIDAALRRLGVAPSALATATITDDLSEAAIALAEYNALRRFRIMAARRLDTNTGRDFATTRTQFFSHLNDLLTEAAERCAALGYPTKDAAGWSLVRLNLDSIEPDAAWRPGGAP